MSDVYEPWAPEIGQRVRVRINPECAWPLFHTNAAALGCGPLTVVDAVTYAWLDEHGHRHGHRFEVANERGVRMIVATPELEPVS